MAEKEYIEREAAITEVAMMAEDRRIPVDSYSGEVIGEVIRLLRGIPASDVRPVVRGKWVDEPIKGIRYYCSVCQGRFDYTWHYCPNCGADMMEES